jgi:hypothetical protein
MGVPSPLQFLVTGLTAGTPYDFEIRSEDDAGLFSAWSTPPVTETTNPGIISPDSIAGLVLWLKADALPVIADNTTFSPWTDSSSAGNDASQATSGLRPTYQTNEIDGLPAVKFDSTIEQSLVTPSMPLIAAWTVFLVVKSLDSSLRIMLQGGADTHSIIQAATSTNISYYNDPAEVQIGTLSITDYQIITCDVGSSVAAAWMIGRGVSFPFNGLIAEIIAYDTALSSPNKSAVQAYLANKYPSAL